MKRRTIAAGVVAYVFVLAGLLGYWWASYRAPVLTVATWPGSYGHAQASALLRPFADRSGADVRIAEYDGGITELARQVDSRKHVWDVVDMELPDAVAACHQGLLERIDASTLPAGPNGKPAFQDFAPGAIGPCWVASVVYSQVIAFDPHRFRNDPPSTLADFFDVKKYPGPRALRRASGKLNLEMALLADGVRPEDIYRTLSTPQGMVRALAKLDTIKSDLVWWTPSDPPTRMLADGRAAFSTILNGDVFDAATRHIPLGVIWDRQLYEFEVFGIPKGDPMKRTAMDFIRFATQAQNLAGVANWVSYGPARASALPYVGVNPELKTHMLPYLPTTSEHFATAFAVDDEWWRVHGADVDDYWRVWQAKEDSAAVDRPSRR